jgi:predicted NAD/FAD-binding protein
MIKDILHFNRHADAYLAQCLQTPVTLGALLRQHGYGERFREAYMLPMAAAIWSSSPRDILDFPAATFLRFCLNHGLLQVNDRPQWRTVAGGSRNYVAKMAATLPERPSTATVLLLSAEPPANADRPPACRRAIG